MEEIVTLLSLAFLVKLGLEARQAKRYGLGKLHDTRRRQAVLRAWPALPGFAAGMVLSAAGGGAFPAAAGLIAFALLFRRWSRADKRGDGPDALAFLERLQAALAEGLDFFEGLGTAGRLLPEGRLQAAVRGAVERHADRLPRADCLQPLTELGGALRELAVDSEGVGSAALSIVVDSVIRRAIARWDRGSRLRLLGAWTAGFFPMLLAAATGAAVDTAGPAPALAAGLLGFLLPGLRLGTGRNLAWQPMVFLGSSLAAAVLLLPRNPMPSQAGAPIRIRTYDPVPLFTPRLDRMPPAHRSGEIQEEPAGDAMHYMAADILPIRRESAFVRTCRVSTGVENGWAHVRDTPGMDGRVLFYAAEGEVIEARGRNGLWIAVRSFEGRVGWIFEALCSRVEKSDSFKQSGVWQAA